MEFVGEGKRWYDLLWFGRIAGNKYRKQFIDTVVEGNQTTNQAWIQSVLQDKNAWYMPLPQPKDKNRGLKLEEDPLEFRDDDNKIVYLQRFISYCKQKGILLILVVSPKYTKVAPDCYATPKKIAEDNGIPFLDYHTHALYHTHPEYFKDINHLYDKGARLFSSAFAFDLKRCVSSRTGTPQHSHCP